MPLQRFHPAVSNWFQATFPSPSECQEGAWKAIGRGHHVLIAAPTGSGKTLAAFLSAIDELAREGEVFGLPDETRVLYISPLKALSNDIQRNLEAPLEGIQKQLFEEGATQLAIRAQVRTGDTPPHLRAAMGKRPPHILVTTPESAYLLLTSDSGRRMLSTVRTVIVDEIHALVGSKRGSHLSLSLERLDRLTGHPLLRIGLSATQNPIETVAAFLTGGRHCQVVDSGHRRTLDLGIELPLSPLEAVLSGEAAKDYYDRLAELIEEHRTTLVFVNTRRLAERLARALSERIGESQVTSHHGSLSREQRHSAEQRLKRGELKALVATASMELGIDVGDIDLVCQWSSPGSIAALLQRVGRSGHFAGGVPKGRLFPTSRDDLLEAIALLDAIRRGELDRLVIPSQPLDVLAQQIVAMVACEEFHEDELYRLLIRSHPYHQLKRKDFDELVQMLAEGFSTRRGVRGAYLHRDGIHRRLRGRKGARLTAVTCGGAIPDNAEYRVILEPQGELIGSVDEDFAIDSMSGDIFQLGNASWRVLRLEGGAMRVEDARHQPPSIPFWFGEAPGRTFELSQALSRLRRGIETSLEQEESSATVDRLIREVGVSRSAAEQAVNYLAAAKRSLGLLPTLETLIFERFFDESGGMQLIIHSPYGNRVNRGWGLALRKRFCRSFNFELQAAATENAIILSLGTSQSFELAEVARYLSATTIREILIQALLDAPMFTIRWRWNAVCSLALKRFQAGRKTPPYLLRMQAEDLVTTLFPDQLACLENIAGDREIPDHPLVRQTLEDCLTEAMDIERLTQLIDAIEKGEVRVVCRDLVEPSPLAAEIVNSQVYSFLDGAPLEERRTRAVASRRCLDPATADDLGRLDPAAIEKVSQELWPEVSSLDEMHEALLSLSFLNTSELSTEWLAWCRNLDRLERAAAICLDPDSALWVAAERLPLWCALYPTLSLPDDARVDAPRLTRPDAWDRLPDEFRQVSWSREEALQEIVRGRLASLGPLTTERVSRELKLPIGWIEQAFMALQSEGFVLRGAFRQPGADEWCERHLLARIHRHTLNRLRQEVEPVAAADFMRFLFRWQQVDPETRMQGSEALIRILDSLAGFEAPATAWEGALLPARVADYHPDWLDRLCFSGRMAWCRLSAGQGATNLVKSTPIGLLNRTDLGKWRHLPEASEKESLSASARHVAAILANRGALFFDELVTHAGMLNPQLEAALSELVVQGLITADSFQGLRALLIPERKKQRYGHLGALMNEAGRWSLLPDHQRNLGRHQKTTSAPQDADEITRSCALTLLKRYGIVFRSLLHRESASPPWLELLKIYRRMEARGEIRGGRFVTGAFGEQFALPEAVEALRSLRKQKAEDTPLVLSAADPLCLVGQLNSGTRIPAKSGNRVLYRGGVPIASWVGGTLHFLAEVSDKERWSIEQQLRQTLRPPTLKAYLD